MPDGFTGKIGYLLWNNSTGNANTVCHLAYNKYKIQQRTRELDEDRCFRSDKVQINQSIKIFLAWLK